MATTKKANARVSRKKAKATKKTTTKTKAKKSTSKSEESGSMDDATTLVEETKTETNVFEDPQLLQDVTTTELEVISEKVSEDEAETAKFFPQDLEELEIRKTIVDLRNNIDVTRFELGRVLYYTKANNLHSEWGYTNWANYLDSGEAGRPRTARYLTDLHAWFEEDIKDKETIDKIKAVGWSKAKEIMSIVKESKEPLDAWIKEAHELSLKKLAQLVKDKKTELFLEGKGEGTGEGTGEGEDGETKEDKTTKLSFNVYAEDYKIIKAALALMDKEIKGGSEGTAISYICQQFINDALVAKDRGELVKSVLPSLEDRFDGKIVFVDGPTEEVIYGQELLDG